MFDCRNTTALDRVAYVKLKRHSRGFTLVELSLVLFIGSSFLMAMTFSVHSYMLQLRAKSMAQRYQLVHAAALRYVDVFGSSLALVSAECGRPLYQADSPLTPTALLAKGGCSLQLDNRGRSAKVVNALQPTTEELKALGFMDPQATTALLLEREVRVYMPIEAQSESHKAPERLAVLVRKVCETPGCSGPVVLESMTYNMQPFLMQGGHWLFDRFDQAHLLLSELGDGAAMSQEKSLNGNLEGIAGDVTFENPVKKPDKQGLAGIVALRSRFNDSVAALWARRDGQSEITGDWRFGSHNIRGVAKLEARAVLATDMRSSGSAELNMTTAQTLNVAHLYPQNIRLPNASQGQACDPQQANLAIDSANGRLLICDAAYWNWRTP